MSQTANAAPAPMLLWCPECRARHIDVGEFAVKPHHTHACQFCGHCWRPAVIATVGVQFLPGFKDAPSESVAARIPANTATAPEAPAGALTWSPTLDCGRVEHERALKAVAKLNEQAFQGHTDWRLPEIRELLSLVDYSRADPAIDVEQFPDTKSAWYWTATPFAGDAAYAWVVDLYDGDASWSNRDNVAFVRAVRGPVARARQ